MSTKQYQSTRLGFAWPSMWVGLAAVLAIIGFTGQSSSTRRSGDVTSVANRSETVTRAANLKAIEDVQIGDVVKVEITQDQRQIARGSFGGRSWDSPEIPISEEGWRKVALVMTLEDGDVFDIQLLRPTTWFEESGAALGRYVQICIPEQSLDGPALVTSIDPCPRIAAKAGGVVTGTFTHVRGGILRLHVDGAEEPLGITANHPVWSVDEQNFVLASTLSAGARLQLLDRVASITRIEPVTEEQRVYNLEIRGDHVYHVTPQGILVHNASQHGSYTVTFSDGTVYHGKGSKARSEVSAKRVVKEQKANGNNIQHTSTDWKPASSQREAFKAEARRIDNDGGIGNSNNHNKIQSPGRKYIKEDGGSTVH